MTFGSVFGRTFSPTFQPKSQAAAGGWWDLNGTITSCVAAYQAKGAASYAASLVNLTGNSTYDLTEADGSSPTWDTSYGWAFTYNTYKRLNTGIIISDTSWSFIIRYSDFTVDDKHLCGGWLNEHMSGIRIRLGSIDWANYSDWFETGYTITLANAKNGVTAAAGRNGYWNGSKVFENIADDTSSGNAFYLGGRNYTNSSMTGKEQAFAIYNSVLTDTQISDLSTAMAAL